MEKKRIAVNKKARHEYYIEDDYEAGIMLVGTEVKSLRQGKVSIKEAFAKVSGNEIFIHNMHISEYDKGNIHNHEPLRVRKLLMHKREIKKIIGLISTKGVSFVPLSIYFSTRGIAKIKMGIARGKKLYDKRESIKKNMQDRELAKIQKYKNR